MNFLKVFIVAPNAGKASPNMAKEKRLWRISHQLWALEMFVWIRDCSFDTLRTQDRGQKASFLLRPKVVMSAAVRIRGEVSAAAGGRTTPSSPQVSRQQTPDKTDS